MVPCSFSCVVSHMWFFCFLCHYVQVCGECVYSGMHWCACFVGSCNHIGVVVVMKAAVDYVG